MCKEDTLNVPYVESTEQYIPTEINSKGLCYCGFVKHDNEELCQFCSSNLYKEVKNSAEYNNSNICSVLTSFHDIFKLRQISMVSFWQLKIISIYYTYRRHQNKIIENYGNEHPSRARGILHESICIQVLCYLIKS